jgi:hypothetical protein
VPSAVEVIAIATAAQAGMWSSRPSTYIHTTADVRVTSQATTARAPSRVRSSRGSISMPARRNSIPSPSSETNETWSSTWASPRP